MKISLLAPSWTGPLDIDPIRCVTLLLTLYHSNTPMQMLRVMLEDILQQQRQLRAMAKPPGRITMDFLFGANSVQNQHLRKTGTHYILSRVWNSMPNATWMYFEVNSFTEFWNGATLRSVEAPGLAVDTHFLFGRMVSPLRWSRSRRLIDSRYPAFTISITIPLSPHSPIACTGARLPLPWYVLMQDVIHLQ